MFAFITSANFYDELHANDILSNWNRFIIANNTRSGKRKRTNRTQSHCWVAKTECRSHKSLSHFSSSIVKFLLIFFSLANQEDTIIITAQLWFWYYICFSFVSLVLRQIHQIQLHFSNNIWMKKFERKMIKVEDETEHETEKEFIISSIISLQAKCIYARKQINHAVWKQNNKLGGVVRRHGAVVWIALRPKPGPLPRIRNKNESRLYIRVFCMIFVEICNWTCD